MPTCFYMVQGWSLLIQPTQAEGRFAVRLADVRGEARPCGYAGDDSQGHRVKNSGAILQVHDDTGVGVVARLTLIHK